MNGLGMTGDILELYKPKYRSLETGYMDSSPKAYDVKKSLNLSVPPFPKL